MLPKNAVIGVHHDGGITGSRNSSASWCRAGAHSGGGAGPGCRLATTSAVRASSAPRLHESSFDRGKERIFTKLPYFGHRHHRNEKCPSVFVDRGHFGLANEHIVAWTSLAAGSSSATSRSGPPATRRSFDMKTAPRLLALVVTFIVGGCSETNTAPHPPRQEALLVTGEAAVPQTRVAAKRPAVPQALT